MWLMKVKESQQYQFLPLMLLIFMLIDSVSAEQEIVRNRIGKEVNIFATNWWARMTS